MGVSETISQVNESKEVLSQKINSYNQITDALRQEYFKLQATLDNGGQTAVDVGNQVQNIITLIDQSKSIITTETGKLDNFIATLNQ